MVWLIKFPFHLLIELKGCQDVCGASCKKQIFIIERDRKLAGSDAFIRRGTKREISTKKKYFCLFVSYFVNEQ